MKSRISAENAERPPKSLAISISEIALIAAYFLAVWLIPTSWLDTAIGAMAFAIAGTINPYLSPYSIAFAADPQYFIHCHVLATWLFPPLLPYLIVRRYGGRVPYSSYWRQRNDQLGGWISHLLISLLGYAFAYLGMYWLVDYPLTNAEWAIWVGSVALSAFVLLGAFSIGLVQIYMIMYSALSGRRNQ